MANWQYLVEPLLLTSLLYLIRQGDVVSPVYTEQEPAMCLCAHLLACFKSTCHWLLVLDCKDLLFRSDRILQYLFSCPSH